MLTEKKSKSLTNHTCCSDNTNFVFLSATLMDTAAIYGPCAAAFGMEPWHPAIADAFAVITGEKLEKKEQYKDNEQVGSLIDCLLTEY